MPPSTAGRIAGGGWGATVRFLTAIAGTSRTRTTLVAGNRLAKRPLERVVRARETVGGSRTGGKNGGGCEVKVHGPLKGGETGIRGDVSSQFISGLLFAAPLAASDVTIHLNGRLESRPYVEMSLHVLKRHGISIDVGDNDFHIPAPQKYTAAFHDVPGDFSSSAFLIAGGGLAGEEITVSGLNPGSGEPDAVFLKVVDQMGLEVRNVGQTLEVRGSKLEPFEFDAMDNPDLVPPLEVLGCFARGTSEIRGMERLRYKETNRLQTIPAELVKMGPQTRVPDGAVNIQ